MATLADSFLQDLEDLGEEQPTMEAKVPTVPGQQEMEARLEEEDLTKSKLLDQEEFNALMDDIRQRKDDSTLEAGQQLTEEHEEYQLIVRCNSLAREIDEDMLRIFRGVREKYVKRFPELDSIILSPLDYLAVVQRVGNSEDITALDFTDFLPNTIIMAMTVTFSMSTGKILEEEEMDKCQEGCSQAFLLNDCKRDVLLYLESRMSGLAPNLSALLGASLAAKLITASGGLFVLRNMPSQNIMHIGVQKASLLGRSSAHTAMTGLIMHSDIVMATPLDFRNRAIRLVAGKCSIAAKVDSWREAPLGQKGTQLREEILSALQKAQQPPPAKQKKALPVPVERLSNSKRGGKRWRAQKEKYGMSDFAKLANRMKFGEQEEDISQEHMGIGFGMLSKYAGTGQVRGSKAKRLEQQMSSIKRQRMAAAAGNREAGNSSSLAFTPVQGIELANPEARREKKAAETAEKYFNQTATFVRMRQ